MAKTYDTYKDSGIAWIGEIPGDWEVCSLKYQTKFINGFAFNSNDFQKKGEMPVFRIGDIIEDNISIKDNVFVNKQNALNNYEVRKGDILLAMSGATTGKIGIIKNQIGYINQRVGIVRSTIQPWIFYNLKSNIFSEYVLLKAIGSAQPNISTENFNNYKIPLPPLSVQQSISSFLDTKCGEIDSLISIQEEMISELLAYKQSVITEAVTKGLDKKPKMKNSGVEWIGDIPEEWEVKFLLKIIWLRARLGWKGLKAEEYVESGYPFLSAFNIVNNQLVWSDLNYINKQRYEESPEIKLSIGDVLIVKDGAGIGKTVRIQELPYGESTVNSSLGVITPSKILNYHFLYYFLLSNPFQNMVGFLKNGMGVPHLTQENMKSVLIPLPPLPIQQAIATYLDEKTSQIDSLIALKQSKIESLKEYKKSIIYEYVTGKKRV